MCPSPVACPTRWKWGYNRNSDSTFDQINPLVNGGGGGLGVDFANGFERSTEGNTVGSDNDAGVKALLIENPAECMDSN